MQPAMIAEVAYSVYAKMVDNKNVRGEELPLWQDLGDKIQQAWISATSAVRSPRVADLESAPLVAAFDRLSLALGDPDTDHLVLREGETIETKLIDIAVDRLAGVNGVVAA